MTPEEFTVCCVLCGAGTLNGNNENSYMLQQLEVRMPLWARVGL